MRLVNTLGCNLEFVLHPEDVLLCALRMRSRRAKQGFELGCGDDLPQAARGALKVAPACGPPVSITVHQSTERIGGTMSTRTGSSQAHSYQAARPQRR